MSPVALDEGVEHGSSLIERKNACKRRVLAEFNGPTRLRGEDLEEPFQRPAQEVLPLEDARSSDTAGMNIEEPNEAGLGNRDHFPRVLHELPGDGGMEPQASPLLASQASRILTPSQSHHIAPEHAPMLANRLARQHTRFAEVDHVLSRAAQQPRDLAGRKELSIHNRKLHNIPK